LKIPNYIEEFDCLRGVAVLSVMLYHATTNASTPMLKALGMYGLFGVDLFFVLSGFLITGILVRTKESPGYFRNFYAKRGLRIWPLYYALVIFVFVVLPLVQPKLTTQIFETCAPWPYYLVLVQNMFERTSDVFGPISITWSLAIEEQYYLLWPLVIRFCERRWLKPVALLMLALSVVLRIGDSLSLFSLDTYHNTFTRLDGLAIGSFLALFLPEIDFAKIRKARLWAWGIVPICLVSAIALKSTHVFSWTTYLLLAIGFGWLVATSIGNSFFPRTGFLRFTGTISYGLYMLHITAFNIAKQVCNRFSFFQSHSAAVELAQLLIGFAAAYALAFASWHLLEKRILRLKEFFHSSHSPLAKATGA
jgi:peptidoglycan/LPS O-acetylase OafA/YrhL